MSTVLRARLAGVALAVCCACGPAESGAAPPPRPNVVLLSLDTMRADRLSAYGEHTRETTPVLDRLAANAAVFRDCLAASTVTGPSHLSLFTGQLPRRHGLLENGPAAHPRYTLASVLADAGYATAGFTGGGYLRESYGLDLGFETYRARGGPLARFKRTFETSLPFALEWLEQRDRERPFFLFLHGFDPHCPYEATPEQLRRVARVAKPPFDPAGKCGEKHYLPLLESGAFGEEHRAYLADLYDALVAAADASLRPLVRYLREERLLDESIVVFTSDHGESLGEHGWIGHGRLWNEQARVPLFVRFPGEKHRGVVDAPVSLVDLLPTLCDALAIDVPDGVQGTSLMPLLRGDAPLPTDRLRVVSFAGEESVLSGGRHKATFELAGGAATAASLFDLERDPGELDDLAATPGGRATLDDLLARYRAWREATAAEDERWRAVGERPQLDEEEAGELSALGYLDGDS